MGTIVFKMINEQDFNQHLHGLSQEQWKSLFDLLPKIEQTKDFGSDSGFDSSDDGSITFSDSDPAQVVSDFLQVFHNLGLGVHFDWTNWVEGKQILDSGAYDFYKLDCLTLCKLLTTMVRADRFNDGYLISCFEKGIVSDIIKALERNRE